MHACTHALIHAQMQQVTGNVTDPSGWSSNACPLQSIANGPVRQKSIDFLPVMVTSIPTCSPSTLSDPVYVPLGLAVYCTNPTTH